VIECKRLGPLKDGPSPNPPADDPLIQLESDEDEKRGRGEREKLLVSLSRTRPVFSTVGREEEGRGRKGEEKRSLGQKPDRLPCG